jgi:hypothetical protein
VTAPQPRPLSFIDGIGVALTAVALLPLLAMLLRGAAFVAMYQDLGDVQLPLLTRIVLHPAWRIGVPCVVIALALAVLVRRPSYRYAMLAVAALAVLAAVASCVGTYLPVYELAGNIRAD